MTTTLDHVLVPAHDKDRSARFLADMLELEVTDESSGPGPAACLPSCASAPPRSTSPT
ncbi:MAG: hypothetical protein ACR2IP_04860 [Solirubrobacteraceae bacterium]